jgi:nucleoside phosphorylase/glycosyltransferase involved in cell wall biosynthesis
VNRKLANAVALRAPHLEVVALVTGGDAADATDAQRNDVTLIVGEEEDNWTSLLSNLAADESFADGVLAVVGHSYFTGAQAASLRAGLCKQGILVHFIHMSPLYTENLKEYRQSDFVKEREQKLALEFDIARQADVVMCIGPRLFGYAAGHLGSNTGAPQIYRIDCGIERPLLDEWFPPPQPMILCAGRTDSLAVKGFDIFAKIAGHLAAEWPTHPVTMYRPTPVFELRGATDNSETIERQLRAIGTAAADVEPRIYVRPYSTDNEVLKQDLLRASVFLMPSREEGYGLVACEAISVGVPVLLSSESGLAESVQEMALRTGMSVREFIVPHRGSDDDIARTYVRMIFAILGNERFAVDHAHRLREQMYAIASWDAAAESFLGILGQYSPQPDAKSLLPRVSEEDQQDHDGETTEEPRSSRRLSEVLRRHGSALWQPGVLQISAGAAIVVTVEKGSEPMLPDDVDGIPVVIRQVDGVRPLAPPIVRAGDVVLVGGRPAARVGARLKEPSGREVVTTSAHACPNDVSTVYSIRTVNGNEVSAHLVARYDDSDIACLSAEGALLGTNVERIGVPSLGESVAVALADELVVGVVVAPPVSAALRVGQGGPVIGELFEVQVPLGHLAVGDSGSLVLSADSSTALGLVVAEKDYRTSGQNQRIVAMSLHSVLPMMSLSLPTSRMLPPEPKDPRIGVVVEPFTARLMLERLVDTSVVRSGEVVHFLGRLTPRGPRIVVLPLAEFGNLQSAISVTGLLREFDLAHVLLVGIAGGVPGTGVQIGDVVVSSQIVYYEPARIGVTGLSPRFRVVGRTPPWISVFVSGVDVCRGLAGESAVIEKLTQDGQPRVHVGAIASGEKVIHSADALEGMVGHLGGVLAVDMEGAGVAAAVAAHGHNVTFVVVRGIADLLDERKRDDGRELGAYSAISVATQLIDELEGWFGPRA